MQLIGIFGGTFDPPHIGHLILAAEARAQLHLDRLLWMLTPDPPHKRGRKLTPLEQRQDMLELVLKDEPTDELSRLEINRPGPHYAVDTVNLLKEMEPKAGIVYIMGGDSLRDLPTWHQPADLLAACHLLGVMRRSQDTLDLASLENALPGLKKKVRFINAPLLEISSSDIRQRVADGRPFRHFVPDAIYEYIRANGLHR